MSTPENTNTNKRAKRELVYALVGTGITLVFAIGLYLWAPAIRHQLQTKKDHIGYTRSVMVEANSGSILYKRTSADSTDDLKQIASILQRRFERGNFRILTIAESALKNSVLEMQKNKNSMQYEVAKIDGGVALEIKANNATASQALVQYLKILEQHWKD